MPGLRLSDSDDKWPQPGGSDCNSDVLLHNYFIMNNLILIPRPVASKKRYQKAAGTVGGLRPDIHHSNHGAVINYPQQHTQKHESGCKMDAPKRASISGKLLSLNGLSHDIGKRPFARS